jgi:hypothetical protein
MGSNFSETAPNSAIPAGDPDSSVAPQRIREQRSANGHGRPWIEFRITPAYGTFELHQRTSVDPVAEMDGNRTRRTGIARPNRFEGGGAHQVPRHLRR